MIITLYSSGKWNLFRNLRQYSCKYLVNSIKYLISYKWPQRVCVIMIIMHMGSLSDQKLNITVSSQTENFWLVQSEFCNFNPVPEYKNNSCSEISRSSDFVRLPYVVKFVKLYWASRFRAVLT